jgi:plastocyanin
MRPATRRKGEGNRLAAGMLALLAVTAFGCGDDATSGEPSPKVTVVLDDGRYHPARVRIRPGSRVTFVNRSPDINTAETDGVGSFEYDRTKLDRQNRFDIHVLRHGEAESVEFDTPGRYEFHSSLDPGMRGVVEVGGDP